MSIRLLAIDLDGTLLDSQGHVPEANRVAIGRAVDAGVEIVLATGRRYDFARPVFETLPQPLTLILSNGAVVKTRDGQTLMLHLLPRAVAHAVLMQAPEHRESAAVIFDRPREGQVVYRGHRLGAPAASPLLLREPAVPGGGRAARGLPHRRSGAGDVLGRVRRDAGAVLPAEAGSYAESRSDKGRSEKRRSDKGRSDKGRSDARAEATKNVDPSSFRLQPEDPAPGGTRLFEVSLTEYEHRDFSLVDIVQAGCTKGSALSEWAARRCVPRAAVMAIGDNHNDLPMLEFAGTPVVMGNATGELKTRGWSVTSTNDDAGVARAIETFVLEKAS